MVRLKLDVIVTQSNTVALAASSATKTIPIVMADDADPVANGLVASLARPGGNVTGLTNAATDLGVKRLELLKEVFPKLARIVVLPSPRAARVLNEMQQRPLPCRSSFTSWRYGLPTIWKGHSKQQPMRVSVLSR